MLIPSDKLCEILELIKKSSKEEMSLEDAQKKIQNREINILIESSGINFMEPNLLSSFFIRHVNIEVDQKIISDSNTYFDLEMLVSIRRLNNFNFELTDINNRKLKVHKDDIKVSLKKVPLDVFLGLIA